jgi:hypothetical protein
MGWHLPAFFYGLARGVSVSMGFCKAGIPLTRSGNVKLGTECLTNLFYIRNQINLIW